MIGTLLRFVGVDLQSRLASLWSQAEDLKIRATDEVKRQVADTSITIGLAFVSLVLALLTVVAGLAALYLSVAMAQGPFVALGAVAATTAILAIIVAIIAATRGHLASPKRPRRPMASVTAAADQAHSATPFPTFSAAPPFPTASADSPASLVDAFSHKLAHRTAAAANEAMDSAAEIVRKGPREAILATLGVAVVVGLIIGRRR